MPTALVLAIDKGAPVPPAWQRPIRVVIYSSGGRKRLVPLGEAGNYLDALRMVIKACTVEGGDPGSPDAYPLASPEVLAFIAELQSPELREFCLFIDCTISPVWPNDLSEAVYLRRIEKAFPGEDFIVGWEATGPMNDLAWAFMGQRLEE